MQKVANWMYSNDRIAFVILNRYWKSSFTDFIMPLITNLGGAIWSITLCIVLLLSRNLDVTKVGEHLAISLFITHLIVRLFKKFLPRLRPYMKLENVHIGHKVYKDPSFPSGHSTAAFCSATALSTVFPGYIILFFTVAALVAVSRVYLGMHYPSDVTVGAIIAIAVTQMII
ncbi:MAG: hypothetical protein APF84_05670 [Gracilibacter sp. BRH_c7a]|nr:MAG: hypothetical protein APF84_05670 [Gracilibacter sp. BRH_c7a]